MAGPVGYINIVIVGDSSGVQAMLLKMDMALSPPEIGIFLSSEVDPWLRLRAADRFRSEGDDVSGKWAPLTPYTERVRVSQGYPAAHPINRRSGQLENYILHTQSVVAARAGGAFMRYPGTSAAGDTKDKVRVAQQGFQGAGFSTPPRPVLGMNERDLAFVLTALANKIAR